MTLPALPIQHEPLLWAMQTAADGTLKTEPATNCLVLDTGDMLIDVA